MGRVILVGDIGSTKSTWWYQAEKNHELHLPGFNPVMHAPQTGINLFESLRTATGELNFTDIWYYGAGIVDHLTAQIVHQSLDKLFPGSLIHVTSDLTGAAVAACGYTPGAVAILGTGSHAALWDGHKITRQAASLGYILGDEGGGCDIGKALVQAYFYNELPEALQKEMERRLPSGRTGFLKELQASPAPNQYLAEFARVAVLFQEHEWIRELVSARFNLFIKRHILFLEHRGPVHIVGSIGCIFASLIRQELEKYSLSAGTIIKNPAQLIFERHLEHG
jgi:glucosamine kinase